MPTPLPPSFEAWFAARGWKPHAYQREMVAAASQGKSVLLIAPTGGGKTLSGFLPSLVDLAAGGASPTLHTLYISPLKALAVDVHRNLEQPIAEMGLAITTETRTGDTPAAKKQRQRRRPPNILMTTPESLALMLAHPGAAKLFRHLACVIVDEVHALAGTKRGDLLVLALARLKTLAPDCRRIGLSATVAHPDALQAYIDADTRIVAKARRAKPRVRILRAHASVCRGRDTWACMRSLKC